MKEYVKLLFQFGTPAIYFYSTDKAVSCNVFIDTGWRDSISGYESQAAEIIMMASILLQDLPVPKPPDQIQIENSIFEVLSIPAQDDLIAVLHVKRYEDKSHRRYQRQCIVFDGLNEI